MVGQAGNGKRPPDSFQGRVYRLPLLALLGEPSPALGRDPVVLATATALSDFPPGLDVAEPLEPMENRVKHAVSPLDFSAGQFFDALNDRVAVTIAF